MEIHLCCNAVKCSPTPAIHRANDTSNTHGVAGHNIHLRSYLSKVCKAIKLKCDFQNTESCYNMDCNAQQFGI